MRLFHKFETALIFNFDETMISLGDDKRKVAVFNDEPIGYREKNEKIEHITLMLCISAQGGSVKPTAIFPLRTLPELPPEVCNYFAISGSDSGWINGIILNAWLTNIFIPHVNNLRMNMPENSPALLLLDNHSSRESIDIEKIWREHQIMILLLPPNTTHLTQPLDATVNGVLKKHFAQIFEHNLQDNTRIRRAKVMIASMYALSVALSTFHVVQGWIHTGLEPIDQNRPLSMAVFEQNEQLLSVNELPAQRRRGPSILNNILISEEGH